uniref:Uncharacterized protein n=1 Tax=Glossina palpalis gambiensis TaxID=67801 RepID=A0A1B0C5C4_9MUSC
MWKDVVSQSRETPGRTQDDVAEVCRNLLINHLEIRWDNSIDVSPYVHKRHMQTVVVSLGEQIQEIRQNLLQIIDPYLRQLIEAEVLSGHKENINRNFLLYEQKKLRERSLRHGNHPLHATVNSNFRHFHQKSLMQKIKQQVGPNPFEGLCSASATVSCSICLANFPRVSGPVASSTGVTQTTLQRADAQA